MSVLAGVSRLVPRRTRMYLIEIPEDDPVVLGHLSGIEHGSENRRNLIDALRHSDTSAYLKIQRVEK